MIRHNPNVRTDVENDAVFLDVLHENKEIFLVTVLPQCSDFEHGKPVEIGFKTQQLMQYVLDKCFHNNRFEAAKVT